MPPPSPVQISTHRFHVSCFPPTLPLYPMLIVHAYYISSVKEPLGALLAMITLFSSPTIHTDTIHYAIFLFTDTSPMLDTRVLM